MLSDLKRKRTETEEDKAKEDDFEYKGPEMKQPTVLHPEASGIDADALDLEIGGMWSVSLKALSKEDVQSHMEDLTCMPNKEKAAKGQAGFGKPKTFKIGSISQGRLHMPPWYGKLAFPGATAKRVALSRGAAMRAGVSFSGTLRSHPPQQQAAERYLGWLPKNIGMSCILSLPCGYGKTVLFLALAASLGRVTLVLAHTIALVDQWIEETRAFMPGALVGYIKDGVARVDGVDVVVASVQSLRSHFSNKTPYVESLMARVGTVCMDEGHHAVAGTFWEVMSQCSALYRFVLTATPRRKDGLLSQLQWIAGPVIFKASRKVDDVHVVSVEYLNESHVEIRRGRMKVLDNAAMVTALTTDMNRTRIAVELACNLIHTQGRRVVIVTPRVEHIHELADMLTLRLQESGCSRREVDMFVPERCKLRRTKPKKDESKEECEARHIAAIHEWEDSGPHGSTEKVVAPLVGRVLAGMTKLERDTQYEGLAVVASPNIMEEGVSYKQWDTLIDLNNSSDAEQVVGRILRECSTKKIPLIVDFWINVSLFGALYWKRRKYYKDEDFASRSIKISCPEEVTGALDWSAYNRGFASASLEKPPLDAYVSVCESSEV